MVRTERLRWRSIPLIVHLLRHGESINNLGGQRVPDAALTDVGLQQAAAMAEAWRGVALDAVICSPLWRALQTAEPFLRSVRPGRIEGWPELAELNRSYPSDGRTTDEVGAAFPAVPFAPPLTSVGWPAYPGRETLQQGASRAAALIARVAGTFPRDSRIALIGHQGFGGLLLCAWLGAPPQEPLFRQGNCRAHTLEIADDGVTLVHANAGSGSVGPRDVPGALDIFIVPDTDAGAPAALPRLSAVVAATPNAVAEAIAHASCTQITLWPEFTERPEWVWTRLLSQWSAGGRVALVAPAPYAAALLRIACAAPRATFTVSPGSISHLRWVGGHFEAWRVNDTGPRN